MRVTKAALAELEIVRKQHGGILTPATIVEYAAAPSTALHSFFEWDDTEAAAKYRLVQASYVLRMAVTVVAGTDEKQRMYVSLSNERGGVYRVLTDVLTHEEMYKQLLQDALAELDAFQRKYARLKELGPVFRAARTVRKRRTES